MTLQQQLEELVSKCPKDKLQIMYLDFLQLMRDVSLSNEQVLQQLKQKYIFMNEQLKEALTKEIVDVKTLRKDIDNLTQRVKELTTCRETSIVVTKLQEATMWLGMDLKRINEAYPELNMPNPYPSSKDASTGSRIEPTADNLKF